MGCPICGDPGCPSGIQCPIYQMNVQRQMLQARYYAVGGIQNALSVSNHWTMRQTIGTYTPASREPPKPLESAGMKVEDLIGWRIWSVRNGYLWSYSADYAWPPGGITEGVPGDHDHVGIWAFKEKQRAFQKAIAESWPHVWGSVRLWGQVVEHRDGYRASRARIISIEGGHEIEPERIRSLCRIYGVPIPERMITRSPQKAPEIRPVTQEVSAARWTGRVLVRPSEPKPETPWMLLGCLAVVFSMPLLLWAFH